MAVVLRILRSAQLIENRLDAVASQHGLSHKGDLDVLTALRRVGAPNEQNPSTLARGVQLTTGGMTNRLDRLEGAGLVNRRPDPEDRRGVLVELTEDGKRLVDRALDEVLAEQERLLASLPHQSRSAMADQLEQLLMSLGDRAEELPPDD